MIDYKKDMGLRIKACRKERKLTQEEISEMLGISVKHFSEVERGLTGLSVENLIHLSTILGQSLDYLIKGENADQRWEHLLHSLKSVPQEKQGQLLDLLLTGIRLTGVDAPSIEKK